MAVNELKQEMQDGGAIKPVDASLNLTVSAETRPHPSRCLPPPETSPSTERRSGRTWKPSAWKYTSAAIPGRW